MREEKAGEAGAVLEFVTRPPHLAASAFVWAIVLGASAFLVFSLLVRVPVSIRTTGVLATASPALKIQAPFASRVLEVKVRENQTVEPGDVLVVTDASLAPAEREVLEHALADVRHMVALARGERCDERCLQGFRTMADSGGALVLKAELREKQLAIQEALRAFLGAKMEAEGALLAVRTLENRMRETERSLMSLHRSRMQAQMEFERSGLSRELGNLESEVAAKRAETSAKLARALDLVEMRVRDLSGYLSDFRDGGGVTAPVAGLVSHLAVSGKGELLERGKVVMEIVPRDEPLVATLQVDNRDVGVVEKGQESIISIHAFPEGTFGPLRGTVEDIALSPEVSPAGSRYRVTVALARQGMSHGGRNFPFRPGMTLDASIVVRRERLLRLAFDFLLGLEGRVFGP